MSALPDQSARLAAEVSELAAGKGAGELVALDVHQLVSYTDVLVVATARSERQAKAVVDEVRVELKRRHGLVPRRVEGERSGWWVLVDYVDCVLHLFSPEARERYRLEQLWGEAERLDVGAEPPPAASAS